MVHNNQLPKKKNDIGDYRRNKRQRYPHKVRRTLTPSTAHIRTQVLRRRSSTR